MLGKYSKRIAILLLRQTKYPEPIVKVINNLPVKTNIEKSQSVSVERGCTFIGNVRLGPDVTIGRDSHLEGDIEVGRGTNLVREDELIGDITVGNFCAIARDVTVQARDHLTSRPSIQMRFYQEYLDSSLPHVSKGRTKIGSDVWIGTDVTILSGVNIGHGAIIGAGAVVTKDVQPYEIVAGVPATHKGWRFGEEIREQLLETQWWEWDAEKLRKNHEFFQTNLEQISDIRDLLVE
nr:MULTISPECIES: CatB-related O-acetyltransferase [Haloferax]